MRLLGGFLRLASDRGSAECPPAVPDGHRRTRHTFPARPFAAPGSPAPRDHTRRARLGCRVPRSPRPALRSRRAWRGRRGRLPRGLSIAPRLRVQRQADPARLGRRSHRCSLGGPHGPARLRAVWSPGKRLGTSISASLAQQDPGHVVGIHLTPPLAPPDPATLDDLTKRERAALASLEYSAAWDSGYSLEHATRPQTIGYALVDSPAALCACGRGAERLLNLAQRVAAPLAALGGEAFPRHPLLERASPRRTLRRLRAA
jgi:hypothetical protein